MKLVVLIGLTVFIGLTGCRIAQRKQSQVEPVVQHRIVDTARVLDRFPHQLATRPSSTEWAYSKRRVPQMSSSQPSRRTKTETSTWLNSLSGPSILDSPYIPSGRVPANPSAFRASRPRRC